MRVPEQCDSSFDTGSTDSNNWYSSQKQMLCKVNNRGFITKYGLCLKLE